jgi:hypothetical protein
MCLMYSLFCGPDFLVRSGENSLLFLKSILLSRNCNLEKYFLKEEKKHINKHT